MPDPKIIGNAGSFFKNPKVSQQQYLSMCEKYGQIPAYSSEIGKVKIAAGWLIDNAGCKGLKMGNAGTYEKQALVLVNYGNAEPIEVVDVAKYIQNTVCDKYGIMLEPEVRIYGSDGECGL